MVMGEEDLPVIVLFYVVVCIRSARKGNPYLRAASRPGAPLRAMPFLKFRRFSCIHP
jgi:hypothetical protein